ncbi:hypothetical protein PC9H_006173 [Pleurotus ostreatus]|uniref:non-specific serine/threonine protein kinase n=1 Tax=Pleurotus ostreatus TaxID=5322 RepID=A0A8H7A0F8_PLEOS|nr:uncharacterized protein PC9H_006173 [Pleurotus ostreatus]KAF7430466.1 hypothetical protein PC9H_006173 [Pleurotus ostreatus]
MSDPLGCVIIECRLSGARVNRAQNIEMPRVRTAPSTRPPLTGRITEVVPLQEGEFTQVYRGTLRIPGFKPMDVAVKTDAYAVARRPDDFVREIDAYERKLRSFQGDSIPKCYGLYQLQVSRFSSLDFLGPPSTSMLIIQYNSNIINKLTTLHHAGFRHGDLEDYNIVVDDGKAMFIDLEDVEPHHCQLKCSIIPDDLQPTVTDFGCREIYHIVYMLDVWQKPFVNFYGSDIYLAEITPDVQNICFGAFGFDFKPKANAQKLIEDVEEWRKFYATITDEQRKFVFSDDASASEPEDSGSSSADSSSDSEPKATTVASDT